MTGDKECLCCSSSSHSFLWVSFLSSKINNVFALDYCPSGSDILEFHYSISFKIRLTQLPISVSQDPLLRNNA